MNTISNRQLTKSLIRDRRASAGCADIFNNMIWHSFINRESVACVKANIVLDSAVIDYRLMTQ